MPANFWSCRGCSGCFDADMGRVLITDCLHVRFWLVFCNSVGIEVGGRVYLFFGPFMGPSFVELLVVVVFVVFFSSSFFLAFLCLFFLCLFSLFSSW